MKAKDLRNSILMMAVQGKLVEQNPHDESASILLEKIRAEKAELIKQKKIKKEKPLPEIMEEEKPFDLPENWEWVRLGEIFNISTGMTPLKGEKRYYEDGNIPWATSTLTSQDYIFETETCITEYALKNTSLKIYPVGTLILAMYGQGKTRGQISELGIASTINQACAALEEIYLNCDIRKYIKIFHLYNYNMIRMISEGSAQPNLNLTKIKETIIPLPPLAEQQRIVAKLDELMPQIDEYEHAETTLTSFEQEFPDKMRSSILQAAVQGKLVAQNPQDEPASVLLEKIRAEKAELIKQKKIKKERLLPEITEEEKSFDLPDGWEWVRLGQVVSVQGGKRIPAGEKLSNEDTGHKYIRVTDMKNGTILLDNIKYIDEEIYQKIKQYTISKEDLYITVAGTIGCVGDVPGELDEVNLTENADKLIFREVNKKFLKIILNSFFVQNQISDVTTKVGQPKLAIRKIEELIIVLPPLAEQNRIANKIEKMLSYCDRLQKA